MKKNKIHGWELGFEKGKVRIALEFDYPVSAKDAEAMKKILFLKLLANDLGVKII